MKYTQWRSIYLAALAAGVDARTVTAEQVARLRGEW